MYTQNTVVDYSCYGQKVEYFATLFPWIGVAVFGHAFVVEAVHLSYLPGFVIAAQQCDFALNRRSCVNVSRL